MKNPNLNTRSWATLVCLILLEVKQEAAAQLSKFAPRRDLVPELFHSLSTFAGWVEELPQWRKRPMVERMEENSCQELFLTMLCNSGTEGIGFGLRVLAQTLQQLLSAATKVKADDWDCETTIVTTDLGDYQLELETLRMEIEGLVRKVLALCANDELRLPNEIPKDWIGQCAALLNETAPVVRHDLALLQAVGVQIEPSSVYLPIATAWGIEGGSGKHTREAFAQLAESLEDGERKAAILDVLAEESLVADEGLPTD